MIGSFLVTFTERQASQFKITVFYFYPARVLKLDQQLPAVAKQPKPTYCYEGKRIMKIHQTKLSAAVSSMWKLAQMTQIVVFRCAQKGVRSLMEHHSIFLE